MSTFLVVRTVFLAELSARRVERHVSLLARRAHWTFYPNSLLSWSDLVPQESTMVDIL